MCLNHLQKALIDLFTLISKNCVREWNQLDQSIKNCAMISGFKSELVRLVRQTKKSILGVHAILFQTVLCFAFLGSYMFISDKKVKAKCNKNRNCIFFIPLGISRVAHWIISFMLHIFVITSPTN